MPEFYTSFYKAAFAEFYEINLHNTTLFTSLLEEDEDIIVHIPTEFEHHALFYSSTYYNKLSDFG
jgi:hypothetical protein